MCISILFNGVPHSWVSRKRNSNWNKIRVSVYWCCVINSTRESECFQTRYRSNVGRNTVYLLCSWCIHIKTSHLDYCGTQTLITYSVMTYLIVVSWNSMTQNIWQSTREMCRWVGKNRKFVSHCSCCDRFRLEFFSISPDADEQLIDGFWKYWLMILSKMSGILIRDFGHEHQILKSTLCCA